MINKGLEDDWVIKSKWSYPQGKKALCFRGKESTPIQRICVKSLWNRLKSQNCKKPRFCNLVQLGRPLYGLSDVGDRWANTMRHWRSLHESYGHRQYALHIKDPESNVWFQARHLVVCLYWWQNSYWRREIYSTGYWRPRDFETKPAVFESLLNNDLEITKMRQGYAVCMQEYTKMQLRRDTCHCLPRNQQEPSNAFLNCLHTSRNTLPYCQDIRRCWHALQPRRQQIFKDASSYRQ